MATTERGNPSAKGISDVAARGAAHRGGSPHRADRRSRPWRSWREVDGVVGALTQQATGEILALVPSRRSAAGDWGLSPAGCRAALSRGVAVRIIYEDGPRDPRTAERIASLVDVGVQGRLMPHVPQAVVVVDRRAALLSPCPTRDADVLVREPMLVEVFATVFSTLWRHAEPGPSNGERYPPEGVRDRVVLDVLCKGVTDECAAHVLCVSTRTYRRWVADLMDRLGASSRFQAGALAARRGWVEKPVEPVPIPAARTAGR